MIPIDQNIVMPRHAQIALKEHFGETLSWTLMQTQGTRHHLFLAEFKTECWIARVEPKKQAAPGVDPFREHTVLNALREQDWAVSGELINPELGLLLMPFAGKVLARHELSVEQVEEICCAVRQMHRISNVPLLDYAEIFQRYRAVFKQSNPGMGQLVDETEALFTSLPDIGQCLVHHDLHSGNMLWSGRLRLIDWEYAGLGNPWLDYATLERDIGLSLKQLQSFERLTGFEVEEMEHWLASAIQVIDQLETLWQRFNHLQALTTASSLKKTKHPVR